MAQVFHTNLGNSIASTQEHIRSEESLHWILGLRAAELIIFSKEELLETTSDALKKAQRDCAVKKEVLAWQKKLLCLCQWIPLLGVITKKNVGDLEEEISAYHRKTERNNKLIQDCIVELGIALEESERIKKEHPEAEALSCIDLDRTYGAIAFREKQARHIISRQWAMENHLPESVGELVFSIPSAKEREQLMIRVKQLESLSSSSEISLHDPQNVYRKLLEGVNLSDQG
ncbi:MAG: hypothetical protein WBB28_01380 [Crinalium sp.]